MNLNHISDVIKIVFIGKAKPQKKDLRNILTVRRQVVVDALTFLKQHHSMYSDIPMSSKNIRALPKNDVPTTMMKSITVFDKKNEDTDDLLNLPYMEDPVLLTHTGIADVDGSEISEKEKKCAAVGNHEPVIAIPHGALPVIEYNNPCLWLGSFPHLYPYGLGGPVTLDGKQVPLRTYLKHLLNLCYHQYRKELPFVLSMYNVIHKQEVCLQTALTIRRPLFCKQYYETIDKIKSSELRTALLSKQDISQLSEKLQSLLKQLHAVGSRIPGTAYAKKSMRKEIHGLMIALGMPLFFITINPSDTNSPIVCHIAGVEIDLDRMFDVLMPDKEERARITSEDPTASAKYFNLVIENVLDKLLAYKHPDGGVLGHVSGYYGVLEEQGRGSLHCHLMVWMHGYQSPTDMKKMMREDPLFQTKVLKYFECIIKQDIGRRSPEAKGEHTNDEILCRRPCDAKRPTFQQNLKDDLEELVPLVNTHRHTDSCHKYDEDKCRYGFLRAIVKSSYVTEDQEIVLKRLDERINNYEECIMTCIRANLDIKPIPSGKDCRALAFYVTDYQTKSELSTYNTLEILEALLSDLEKRNISIMGDRKLIKMLNRVLTEREVSAPHVIHLCLGNNDKYCSHQFRTANVHLMLTWLVENEDNNNVTDEDDAVANEVWMNLERDDSDDYVLVNQEIDYHMRGPQLSDMCFYDYVSSIEKVKTSKEELHATQKSSVGRPPLPRYDFDRSHPQSQTHIQRKRDVKLIPKLSYFPPSEDRNIEMFSKIMLLLFKPHYTVCELNDGSITWKEAFSRQEFHETHKIMMRNVREMHKGMREREEIRLARQESDHSEEIPEIKELSEFAAIFNIDESEMYEYDTDTDEAEVEYTQETRTHCLEGMRHLTESKLQMVRTGSVTTDWTNIQIGEHKIKQWNKDIQNRREEIINSMMGHSETAPDVISAEQIDRDIDSSEVLHIPTCSYRDLAEDICSAFNLNDRQKEAYWLFINNVLKRLEGIETTQIIAHMGGLAGCGKSRVIKAIRTFHERAGILNSLRIASPTGTAAALIDGSTIHSLAKIMPTKTKSKKNNTSLSKLEDIWKDVNLLICDEDSMIGCNLLALLSQSITHGKHCNSSIPFGNIDVLLSGIIFFIFQYTIILKADQPTWTKVIIIQSAIWTKETDLCLDQRCNCVDMIALILKISHPNFLHSDLGNEIPKIEKAD